jgi:hypothetical protein
MAGFAISPQKLRRRGSGIAAQAWQATTRPLCIRVLSQRHVCVDSTMRLGARRLREFVSFLVIIAEGSCGHDCVLVQRFDR